MTRLPLETQSHIFTIIFLTYNILWLLSNIVLFVRHRKTQCIQKRNPTVVVAIVLGSVVFFNGCLFGCNMVYDATDSFSSEWLVTVMASLGVLLYTTGYSIVSLSLIVNQLLARIKLDLENNNDNGYKISRMEKIFIQIHQFGLKGNILDLGSQPSVKLKSLGSSHTPVQGSEDISAAASSSTNTSLKTTDIDEKIIDKSNSSKYKAINGNASNREVMRLLAISLAFGAIVDVCSVMWWTRAGVKIDQRSSEYGKIIVLVCGLLFVVFLTVLIQVSSGRDSLGIRTEIIVFTMFLGPAVTFYGIVQHGEIEAFDEFNQVYGSFTLLLPVGFVVWINSTLLLLYRGELELASLNNMQKIMIDKDPIKGNDPKKIQRSNSMNAGQQSEVEFMAILCNPIRFKDLKKSMAEDLCTENALFLEELMKAHSKFGKPFNTGFESGPSKTDANGSVASGTASSSTNRSSSSTASPSFKDVVMSVTRFNSLRKTVKSNASSSAMEKEALFVKHIYQEFIISGSTNELNISSRLRRNLKTLLETTSATENPIENALTLDSLKDIKEEVLRMVYQNNYPKFKKKSINKS